MGTIEEEVTDMKEDGDTIIIQTKVPEELTQSALNSQGDGEFYTEETGFLWNMWLLRMITDH